MLSIIKPKQLLIFLILKVLIKCYVISDHAYDDSGAEQTHNGPTNFATSVVERFEHATNCQFIDILGKWRKHTTFEYLQKTS